MCPRAEAATRADAGLRSDAAPLAWGVIGATSTVARLAVLPAIASSPSARLVAAASLGAGDSYEDVLANPEVEAVYIPLPNGLHLEWARQAAEAGKHVLCEKPLAADPAEAAVMVAACESAGVVLAEAYMTPFHPRSAALAHLVATGGLGEVRFGRAAFTFWHRDPQDHRFDPLLGGGAVADVGIYCLAPLVAAAAGRPVAGLAAAGRFTTAGVDTSLSGWLDFGEGFSASVECSFEAPERQLLEIVGTEAAVSITERAFTPDRRDRGFDLRRRDGTVTFVETGGGDPYQLMIEDFAAVVRGEHAPARTLADSVALIELVQRLRLAARPG